MSVDAAFLSRVGRSILIATLMSLFLLITGCSQAPTTQGVPWWVSSPGAPLPQGFPLPGPLDEVVIKQYPAYRAAVNRADASSTSPGNLFFPLFNHIEENHISMSAPVELSYPKNAEGAKGRSDAMESMAFIYGTPQTGKPGADGKVTVVDVPPMTVASIALAGDYDAEHFQKGRDLLMAWLKQHADAYEAVGEARYLAYNSPFTLPFTRLGEAQIAVRAKVPTAGSRP